MIVERKAGVLVSVNVGLPQDVAWRGQTVHCCSQPRGDLVLDL